MQKTTAIKFRINLRPFVNLRVLYVCLATICVGHAVPSVAQQKGQDLELTRTIRTWEFLPVVGTRAGLFGNETGRLEAWVYPLKIFREFQLTFHVGDYFKALGSIVADPPFLDVVTLHFGIAEGGADYHVPLLVSPWSYSTYRGS